MLGHANPAPPSADDLEIGERVLSSLDEVRYVSSGLPGQVGRLTVTDRNLRFAATRGLASGVLHGFPPIDDLVSGAKRLVVPRSDVRSVTTTRSLGIFSVLRVTVAGGRELTFHCGVRGLAPLVAALSPSAR